MEGSNSYFECHKPKNCSAWFEKYPTFLQAASRSHLLGKDWSSCMAKQCSALGDGACNHVHPDEDLNTPQCHWDGGDCCLLTTTGSAANLDSSYCKDPQGTHEETWSSVRGACSQNVYKNGQWDHCAKGIIGIEHHIVQTPGSSRRNLATIPFTFTSTYSPSSAEDVYGFPPDYMATYNASMYTTIGQCDSAAYSCPDPSLPRIYDQMKGDSTGLYQGEYDDYEFNATAGEYLSVQVDGAAGHIAMTLEVIAPDASGKVDNTSDRVPHKTTSRALLRSQEVMNNGGTQYFNQAQCVAQHAQQCSCYRCFCSCGGSLWDVNSPPTAFCIPYGLYAPCGGAYTNHHRVYLDPPSGGFTLEVSMTKANPDDLDFPMVLYLTEVLRTSDPYCSTNATLSVPECCWPYSGTTQNVGCPPKFSDNMFAMAASSLYVGTERKISVRIKKKGFYLISCKSLGYQGGNYILSTKITNVAAPSNADQSGEKKLPTPGLIKYGNTVGGQLNSTDQIDKWEFDGLINDKVFISMGPGFAPTSMADLSRCGKPYGKGEVCLDTHLTLVSPTGKVEAANSQGYQNDFIGSMIATKVAKPNPFFFETEDGSPYTERKSYPHVLKETGRYTIYAGSSHFTDDKNQRIRNGFSPVGEYYLQLTSAGKHTEPTTPGCPTIAVNATKGFTEPGCPNYVWKGHNARPRVAERHPNCEKFYPIGPPAGNTGTMEKDLEVKNWRLSKTGKYILRVRSLINNCFREQTGPYGESAFVCRPSAGAYDVRLKVRPAPDAGSPIMPGAGFKPYPALNLGVSSDIFGVALNKTYAISHTCGSASPVSDGICYRNLIMGVDECEQSYRYLDTEPVKMDQADVTRVSFNGTQGDIMCVDVTYPSTSPNGVVSKVTKVELKYKDDAGTTVTSLSSVSFKWGYDYIEYGEGLKIKGYKLPKNATYEVWVYGGIAMESYISQLGFNGLTSIKVFKCASEYQTLDQISGGSTCATFAQETKFDKCVANSKVVFSEDDRKVTFPKTKGKSLVISKVGMPISDGTGGNDKPRYYWEVTVGGNPKENWINWQNPQTVCIGVATREVNNQGMWLGGDDQALAVCNSYDTGKIYNNGWSTDYGNSFLPGDTVGVAFDTNTNTFWMSINGTWQSRTGGFDIPGTRYNNYPEASANMYECKPPRPLETMTPSQYTQYGRDKCPINPSKPMCAETDWISGKKRPHCSHGNPVSDGQCTVGAWGTWYAQHGRKLSSAERANLKQDIFSSLGETKLYPAVQGDGMYDTVSFEINFGDQPFKYDIPCSFQPLKNEVSSSPVGPAKTDCWTCKGKCLDHDSTTAPGTHKCKTYAVGQGTDAWYWDYYGMVPFEE